MTKHGTVLLIEDDANDVVLVKKAFEEAGLAHPLQTVNCFKDAIAYLGGNGLYADRNAFPAPFLVMLDLKFSGEEGFSILRWLYERPGLRKKFTVIVLANSGPDQDIQLAYELGAQSCLRKTSDSNALTAALRLVKEYWIDLNVVPENLT
jgi:CheY-like chemotaxis protein